VTLGRFAQWCHIRPDRKAILPNAIHLEQYGVGEKSPDLVARYGLEGKRVLMTLGRMVGKDRAKGFDEVIDLMPRLVAEDPSIVYLGAGRGPDRERLESRAAQPGRERHVIFTGLVPEQRKADYFCLADVYVMPSRGEGFGS
jgi:phosphatidylinositol alpha-1,6-mannosyltransferase